MSQQDQRAAELNHAEEVDGVTFPATAQPAEIFQPGKQPLNLPAPQITPEWPAILGALAFISAVGRDQLHSVFASQPLVQGIAVVRPISDHALGTGGNVAMEERVFNQFRLMRRSACNP